MRLTTQSYTATKTPDLILMVIDHIMARAARDFFKDFDVLGSQIRKNRWFLIGPLPQHAPFLNTLATKS